MNSTLKILSGPISGILLYFLVFNSTGNELASRMAGLIIWIALWWITEPVDLAVTSLVPFVGLPILGILDAGSVASQYMDQVIFLFIGGFLLSIAVEKTELHVRIASLIMKLFGKDPSNILAGVMTTSFLVSMWMSNTATVLMLIPPVTAIINVYGKDNRELRGFFTAMLLGIAYSASLGGMATPVGTPTNMIFFSYINKSPEVYGSISFLEWMQWGVPLSFFLVITCFILLKFLFLRNMDSMISINEKMIFVTKKLNSDQKTVGIVFLATALLWFFRADIRFGEIRIPGWTSIFSKSNFILDSTVAIFMAALLFFIPSKTNKGRRLMEWEDAARLPFGILFLFGGGFALAKGFDSSGLTIILSNALISLKKLDMLILLIALCALITLLSEFASNVATIQLALPVIATLAISLEINSIYLMVPATLAASMGFMLPVATAPNTIVYATKLVRPKEMLKAGIIMDVIGIISIALVFFLGYKNFFH